ncbi:MAG: hypothetical protein ABI780_05805, partial [Ardenticatenales bacterium]
PSGRPARGSRFAYAWRDPDGITYGGAGYVPQIRLVLGEPRLRGIWPGGAVTVTVADRDGRTIGRWSQRTSSGDTRPVALFDARSGPQSGLHRLAPDERVEVVVGGDEPVVFTVPNLALALDDDRGRLTGRLPTGTRGTLAVLEPIDGDIDPLRTLHDVADRRVVHRATLPIQSAPDGTFDVALAGLRDVEGHALPSHRLVEYVVTAERADGNAFMGVVAQPWLWIDAQAVTAEGFGPSGQAVRVDVADAAGRVVVDGGSGDKGAGSIDQPVWSVPLVDAVGAATALRPGDRVTVTIGASRSALTVPAMEAYVDLPAREVRGRAASDTPFTIALLGESWGERRWVVRTGPDGAFASPLPADVPLLHGDWGNIEGRAGPHVVTAQVVVPSMLVDLSVGRIWGRGAAGAPVDVTVLRGGQPIAAGRRIVDDWLGYDLDPHDPSGRRVRPEAGDVIVQRIAGRPPLTASVPVFTARWERDVDAIRGSVTPGSRLDVLRPYQLALTNADWDLGLADVAATGAFTVSARHRSGLATGLDAVLQARAPSGVSAWRWVITPVLNIPHGGDSVCGQALPWARVHAAVTTEGATVQGDGTADATGRFRIPLRQSDGRPVTLATGDIVRAAVDGVALEATLPPLTFRVEGAAGRGVGTAPPGAFVSIEHPVGTCAPVDDSDPIGGPGWLYTSQTIADRQGAFDAPLPALPRDVSAARPPAFEAAILDAAGHRHFRLSRALRLTAVVDTDRVLGEADAGSDVAITLARPGGLVARGRAMADAVGRFTATLAAEGGAPLRLQAGDRVDASADGEARGLTIPPLAVDWRPDTGLTGRTDAGASVLVRLSLPRGRLLGQDTDVLFPLTADAAGRFASAAAGSRGAWTAADVRRVEVWRSLAEDDRAMVAFETGDGPGPSATPSPVGTPRPPSGGGVARVLLPWVGRGAGE